LAADFDQVLAVGAIAVEKHDELLGLPALGVETGTGNRFGHAALRN